MLVKFNPISNLKFPVFKGSERVQSTPQKPDSFEISDKKSLQIKKINDLFPNGGVDAVYKEINDVFKIDTPAKLKLVGDDDGIVGGGFNFSNNEITLSLSDLLVDTKVVGIKNGKKLLLISPNEKLPLFVDKALAENFVNIQSQRGNLGFDKLVLEPVTPDEQRKFIEQKISHEVIHAQQHMMLRQTENIGAKEIIKAWTHKNPQNDVEQKALNQLTETLYEKSFWKQQPESQKTIKRGSIMEVQSRIWLEAIRNYPPVDSPAYLKNAIEIDAYNRSAQYVLNKYGKWN